MDEIIIERPRWGSRMGHKRRAGRFDGKVEARRDPEGLPFRIGLKRAAVQARATKMLNENLRPLQRYLESQVDRPWDKVWSEISQNLRVTSAVQQHVRDHVVGLCRDLGGHPGRYDPGAARNGQLDRLEDFHFQMYVDPRTGLLRRNKHFKTWQRKRREEAAAVVRQRSARMREVASDLQLHLFDDGAWWEVRLAPIPIERVTESTGNTVRDHSSPAALCRRRAGNHAHDAFVLRALWPARRLRDRQTPAFAKGNAGSEAAALTVQPPSRDRYHRRAPSATCGLPRPRFLTARRPARSACAPSSSPRRWRDADPSRPGALVHKNRQNLAMHRRPDHPAAVAMIEIAGAGLARRTTV